MLKKLIPKDLHVLREIYSLENHLNIATNQLLTNFIDRFEKFPSWTEKANFFTLKNSNLSKSGTFVLQSGRHLQFDTKEEFPYRNLVKLLASLDFSEPKMFVNVREDYRNLIVDEMTRLLNFERYYDQGLRLMRFTKDTREFIEEPPSGFKYSSLILKDIPQTLSILPHMGENYANFLKHAIEVQLPTIALHKGEELIAWCAMADSGEMANMVVRSDYRRHHFGTTITCRQIQKILEMGRVPFGTVHFWNYKSQGMLDRLGGEWVGNFSNIGVRKVEFKENRFSWYQVDI